MSCYNGGVNYYPIPAGVTRHETQVLNSRFIATLGPAFSVEEARAFIAAIRREFSDATHHVPAYIIGHGDSVISHCSDDGEPAGTAGRPALAALTGSGLGNVVVVVTRYFGGTKLGSGGLVRAYTEAVQQVVARSSRAVRLMTHVVRIIAPYSWYERLQLLIIAHHGVMMDQEFTAEVTLTARFPVEKYPAFGTALQEASHGSLAAEILSTEMAILPLSAQGEKMK